VEAPISADDDNLARLLGSPLHAGFSMTAAEIQTACAAYPRALTPPTRGQSESTSRFGSATQGHGRAYHANPPRNRYGWPREGERSAAEGSSCDLSVDFDEPTNLPFWSRRRGDPDPLSLLVAPGEDVPGRLVAAHPVGRTSSTPPGSQPLLLLQRLAARRQ
jgi:hypothetical protein